MSLTTVPTALAERLPFAIAVSVVLFAVFLISLRRPELSPKVPKLVSGLPLVGSWEFFTKRWDFYQKAISKSESGAFSFWAGSYPVVGLTGEEGRKVFFESRDLSLGEGYRVLLGGQPGDKDKPLDSDYFQRRLVNLIKGGALRRGLPQLIDDIRSNFDQIENSSHKVIEPFEFIYHLVFQLTMRTVGCNEIADDQESLHKMLSYFETIESCGDKPVAVMFPRMWTFSSIRRLFAGIKLYRTIDGIVSDRRKTGRREEDALQYLLDQGDSSMNAVEFIMGALFAGQLNSGINGAWLVTYLSHSKYWRDQVLAEIRAVTNRHCPDASLSLRDKLSRLPIEVWESEFATIDMCLRDSMRINMNGTAFRRNITNHDIVINKAGEVIPPKAFAVYHVGNSHLNPDLYPNPTQWDPSRYLPERAEDQKEKHAFWGWGAGRHPCLGMRFAKLETYLIVAFWFAYFESETVDAQGQVTDKLPLNNHNANTAKKPLSRSYVKYQSRQG